MSLKTKISPTAILQIISVCWLALLVKKHCEQENIFNEQQYTFWTVVMYLYILGIFCAFIWWILQSDILWYASDVILSWTILLVIIEVIHILVSLSEQQQEKNHTPVLSSFRYYLLLIGLWSYNIYFIGRVILGSIITKIGILPRFNHTIASIESSYLQYPEERRNSIKQTLWYAVDPVGSKTIEYSLVSILLGWWIRYMRDTTILHYSVVGLWILALVWKRWSQRKNLPLLPYIHECVMMFF
jgi:hypothetical protein